MFYTYFVLVVVVEASRTHEVGGVLFFRDAVTTFGEGGGALLWIFLSDCVPYSRSFEFIVARCVVVPVFFWGEFLDFFGISYRVCAACCVCYGRRGSALVVLRSLECLSILPVRIAQVLHVHFLVWTVVFACYCVVV
jgi:hypothetical protein